VLKQSPTDRSTTIAFRRWYQANGRHSLSLSRPDDHRWMPDAQLASRTIRHGSFLQAYQCCRSHSITLRGPTPSFKHVRSVHGLRKHSAERSTSDPNSGHSAVLLRIARTSHPAVEAYEQLAQASSCERTLEALSLWRRDG
jgi:hypothetical protein